MRYFNIEGTIELPDNFDLDKAINLILDALVEKDGVFGGGIKEVDEEGNDIPKE